jgi:hypothetical protein
LKVVLAFSNSKTFDPRRSCFCDPLIHSSVSWLWNVMKRSKNPDSRIAVFAAQISGRRRRDSGLAGSALSQLRFRS